MRTLILFRSRDTEVIQRDAEENLRLVNSVDWWNQTLIVCGRRDKLAKAGDLTPEQAIALLRQDREVGNFDFIDLVPNGATPAQLVPLVVYLFRGWEGNHRAVTVWDVQPDGCTVLEGRQGLAWEDKPVRALVGQDIDFLAHPDQFPTPSDYESPQ